VYEWKTSTITIIGEILCLPAETQKPAEELIPGIAISASDTCDISADHEYLQIFSRPENSTLNIMIEKNLSYHCDKRQPISGD
jgi:hypothetical protein